MDGDDINDAGGFGSVKAFGDGIERFGIMYCGSGVGEFPPRLLAKMVAPWSGQTPGANS
jgi:hypothetical protein